MKLSAYKDLEASKRAQTLSRIILIAGAHLVIIGGAYLVTQFGSKEDEASSLAGVGTWSNQSPNAQQPSVDASSPSLFDQRSGDLSGYNSGEGRSTLLAANANASQSSGGSQGRFAPRRPSESSSPSSSSDSLYPSSRPSSNQDDDILQPLNQSNSTLYPERSASQGSSNLSQVIEYKVQNGDSLWGLSKRFKVAVADITAVNPGIKANAIRVGQTINIPRSVDAPMVSVPVSSSAPSSSSSVPSDGLRYTVRSGDVLSRIASRQGVTVAELKAANGLRSDMIRVGQELVIPTKTRSVDLVSKQHRGPKVTVEAGDSLDKYAALYGVEVAEIVRLNKIEDPRLIRIGQTILIPESASQSPVLSQPATRRPSSTPSRSQSTQTPPPQQQPLQTLDDLAPREESLPVLPTLDDEFDEDDLESQPLIPISE